MKRLFIYIIGIILAQGMTAQTTYQPSDSVKICQLLRQANRETTVLWLARQFMNIPYVAHTLEVNDDERLVVNTRQLDCTTLIETVTALKLCAQQGKRTFADYLAALRLLRYRQGRMAGYPSRLHYFTDWIRDKAKMQLVTDIQQPNPPFSAVQTVNVDYMSTHPTAYKALKANPALVPEIRASEQSLTGLKVSYIPKRSLRNNALLRKVIKDGDILAITCNKKGLDIAHLGFAVWRSNGLHLLNASMLHKKVVEEPMTLYQYMQKHNAKGAGSKLVYAALILYYTLQSPKVSTTNKAMIIGALGYLISPLDVVPDAIPIAGLADDLGVLIFVLKKVWSDVDPDIQVKAKKRLSKWFDEDEIEEINELFEGSDKP